MTPHFWLMPFNNILQKTDKNTLMLWKTDQTQPNSARASKKKNKYHHLEPIDQLLAGLSIMPKIFAIRHRLMEVQQSLIASNDGSTPLKDPFGMFDYSKPNFDKCFDVLSELRVIPQPEFQLDDQLPDIPVRSKFNNVSLAQEDCRPEKLQEATNPTTLTTQELVKEDEDPEVKIGRQGRQFNVLPPTFGVTIKPLWSQSSLPHWFSSYSILFRAMTPLRVILGFGMVFYDTRNNYHFWFEPRLRQFHSLSGYWDG